METTIKKASLSGGLGLKVCYTQPEKDGSISKFDRECSSPVHEDLTKAFAKLNIHLGVISEIIPEAEIDDIEVPCHELLDSFHVQEFEITEHDSGVKLAGGRELSTGKHLSLKTPAVKWGAKKPYRFAGDLAACIETCKDEILQYLFKGKRAPEAQQEIEFPESNKAPDVDEFEEQTA